MKIVLFSNAYPYYGETFLETELKYIPSNIKVALFPFAQGPETYIEKTVNQNVELHRYTGTKDPLKSLVACGRAAKCFLEKNEVKYALQKPNAFRNMAKALKFAYIAELRIPQIAKWIEENCSSQESIVLYSYWMYEVAYLATRLKEHFPYCKFVTRCHGYDLYEERHPNGYLPFRNYILKNVDRVFPISENGKEYLKKLYGDEIGAKTEIARLGTIRKAKIPVKQEREDSIVLVSCSNLVDVKRVHLIINAFMNCRHKVHWYHFGAGELREKLEAQAKEFPVHVKCTFMGYQANEDVQKFYAEHYIDAFINVSQSEGIPVSVMEAESYGIPIIATNVGGTAEIVHDKKNGVLLDVGFTNNDLLDAIDEVVEKADRYRSEALHTWEIMSDAHRVFPEFYKKLAEV